MGWVSMSSGGKTQYREVNGTAGFSQNSRTAHFGLGKNIRIDSLIVRWSNGRVDKRLDLEADTVLRVVEGRSVTAVEEMAAFLPREFVLEQNYPNPFNASTSIRFSIAEAGLVRLVLYNALGQQIRILADEELQAGVNRVVWDSRGEQKRFVASGVYFYRLESSGRGEMRSMVLLR